MFDEKAILARLQNGEDAQKIAEEMAEVINAANKKYQDEKAKEDVKKQNDIQKQEALQVILDLFLDWFETYYNIEVKEGIAADQVIELIDSLKEYIEAIKDLESVFGVEKAAAPIGTKVIKSITKPKNVDEQINDFLKKMGW